MRHLNFTAPPERLWPAAESLDTCRLKKTCAQALNNVSFKKKPLVCFDFSAGEQHEGNAVFCVSPDEDRECSTGVVPQRRS